MLTRDAIISKSYTPAELLDLLQRFERLRDAVSSWRIASTRPGGADYVDDGRLIAALMEVLGDGDQGDH